MYLFLAARNWPTQGPLMYVLCVCHVCGVTWQLAYLKNASVSLYLSPLNLNIYETLNIKLYLCQIY